MSETDERLARIETDLTWVKREMTAIRAKLEKPAPTPLSSRIAVGFAAAIVLWLSTITSIVFFLTRKYPH